MWDAFENASMVLNTQNFSALIMIFFEGKDIVFKKNVENNLKLSILGLIILDELGAKRETGVL